MISFRGFTLLLIIIAVCRAEIIFKSPSMGEVVDPGPYKIRAGDSGIVPTLEQFDDSSWEVVLFTGNDTAPVSLFSLGYIRTVCIARKRKRKSKNGLMKRVDKAMLNTDIYSLSFIYSKYLDTK